MLKVVDGTRTLCQAVFIIHKNNPDDMCVSFFESFENQDDAVSYLMNEGELFAKNHNCKKLIIGLEGHCNNGLGFSLETKNSPSFGECYNKPYYQEYFSQYQKIYATSYHGDRKITEDSLPNDLEKHGHDFTSTVCEYADFSRKKFPQTMKRYTDLNNEIFAEHSYYFTREYEEDRELFNSMRLLLRNNNLIFLKNGDEDIGYIFWYPEFNEFVPVQKGAGWLTYFMTKILKRQTKNAKVVELGVKASYRKTLAAVRLLYEGTIASRGTKYIISSWILDKNLLSTYITKRYTSHLLKKYVLYEKDLSK